MSLITKSVTVSLRANVSVAAWPARRLPLSLVTAIVGRIVSTVIVTVLFASAPSTLNLPAPSENLLLATLTTPWVVLLAVGVKVAV